MTDLDTTAPPAITVGEILAAVFGALLIIGLLVFPPTRTFVFGVFAAPFEFVGHVAGVVGRAVADFVTGA